LLEMPNDRLPASSMAGTMSPMSGPATYQGQGYRRNGSSDVTVSSVARVAAPT
jgi:hypothetical protein